jgi:hypothetical protein
MITADEPEQPTVLPEWSLICEPRHNVSPKCAFCSGDIHYLSLGSDWLYFIKLGKFYFAHGECMQNNVHYTQADDLTNWLRHLGGVQ